MVRYANRSRRTASVEYSFDSRAEPTISRAVRFTHPTRSHALRLKLRTCHPILLGHLNRCQPGKVSQAARSEEMVFQQQAPPAKEAAVLQRRKSRSSAAFRWSKRLA